MEPVSDVRDITRIAYGFKASKALFVAVELDLFSSLAGSGKSLTSLAGETGIAENRLETLLTALTGLGLLVRSDGRYNNAPACEDYLVRGKPAFFGDYFSLQTDQFLFPAFNDLGSLLRGEDTRGLWRDYESLMQENAEIADRFNRGHHAGSLGPAVVLAKQIDVSGRAALLDVAGGPRYCPDVHRRGRSGGTGRIHRRQCHHGRLAARTRRGSDVLPVQRRKQGRPAGVDAEGS